LFIGGNFLPRIMVWQILLSHIKLSDKKLPLILGKICHFQKVEKYFTQNKKILHSKSFWIRPVLDEIITYTFSESAKLC
jgi:hypothetical protein